MDTSRIRPASLAALLVETGLLEASLLDTFSGNLFGTDRELARFLGQHGLCHAEEMVRVICRQGNAVRYLPSDFPARFQGSTGFPMVPEAEARRAFAVPLQRDGDTLFIATYLPPENGVFDPLELITDCRIKPVICSRSEYLHLFRQVYGPESLPEPLPDQSGLTGVSEDTAPYQKTARQSLESGSAAPPLRDQPPKLTSQTSLSGAESVSGQFSDGEGPSSAERMVDALLCQAVCERASDIHFSPERNTIRIQLRIDGKLHDIPAPPAEQVLPMTARIKLLAGMDITSTRMPQDGRFTQFIPDAENRRKEIHIRASCLPTLYGENVVLRLLDADNARITLAELGLATRDEAILRSAIRRPHGMILVSGPTGSGKSTTLHALLQLRTTPDTNIMTLEDPVEYRVDGIRQVQLNPSAGMTFASGLRAILRQDPDIIMVGEIRDDETASIAVQAALTGHLVLSTVHTNDAPGAIIRLIDMGIPPYKVATVLLCVVGQRLVRTICPQCAAPYNPSPSERAAFSGITDLEGGSFRKGTGCPFCHHTGYRGRMGLFEVMPLVPELEKAIIRRETSGALAGMARNLGIMRSLNLDATEKIRNGLTSFEEGVRVAMPEEAFMLHDIPVK